MNFSLLKRCGRDTFATAPLMTRVAQVYKYSPIVLPTKISENIRYKETICFSPYIISSILCKKKSIFFFYKPIDNAF